MIIKIFVLCAILHLINGINGQNGVQLQSDDQYVFDLPPLQIKPLQIKVNPSQSTFYLIRQNDDKKMEYIPIDQYNPQDGLSVPAEAKANLNRIQQFVSNAVSKPLPQSVPQPLPQSVPQPKTEAVPQESSVTYDVPTVQSVLKDLSHYIPYQLPSHSLLYQNSIPNQVSSPSLAPQAPAKNTRTLPSITLPAVTLDADNNPIQTIAVELPSQSLPDYAPTQNFAAQLSPQLQLPKPTANPLPAPTFSAKPFPFSAKPFPTTQKFTAQGLNVQQLAAQRIQALTLPSLPVGPKPLTNAFSKNQVFFIQNFAEGSPQAALLVAPAQTFLPALNQFKPSIQKPITTEIRRRLTLPVTEPQAPTLTPTPTPTPAPSPTQTIETQPLNQPIFLLLQDNGQLQPSSFGFQLTDLLANQQSRKEDINANGVVTGNYNYFDANGIYIADQNGAGIGTNEPGTSSLSSAGVKFNAKPSIGKKAKKPIVLPANQSAPARKLIFSQKRS